MRRTQNGAKRPRDDTHNEPLKFIPGLRLSQHPPEQRKDLFLMKLQEVLKSQSLHPTDFEGYEIRERFAKVGWEQLLNFKCEKIYKRVVIEWTASLSRNGYRLTGIVDGKAYTITPAVIRDLLKIDTCTDLPYARLKFKDLQLTTEENKIRWLEAGKTVFGTFEDVKSCNGWYNSYKMTPLAKILLRIGTSTFLQGIERTDYVSATGIWLLHSLFTGEYLFSFAHLMIDNIWDMYEQEQRTYIPHGNYISEILHSLGAVSKDEYVEVALPQDCLISRGSVSGLQFSESITEYIIDDLQKRQRITFPKIVTEGEAPVEPPGIPKPPSNPLVNMTNIENQINKQSSLFLRQHSELITLITSLQKQMKLQALEAKHREQEMRKHAEEMINNIQKQMEFQALEAKHREQEIRNHAEEMVNNLQKQLEGQALEAERREQEIERRAEVRDHAIICEIKGQRSIHEQEKNQLRVSLNPCNNVHGVDTFQNPHTSHISSELPGVVSKYYDSTQGDEIPKEFQSI